MPRPKKVTAKMTNSWTVRNILIKFCTHLGNDKIWLMDLPNASFHWLRRCQGKKCKNMEIRIDLQPYEIFWWFVYTLLWGLHFLWHGLYGLLQHSYLAVSGIVSGLSTTMLRHLLASDLNWFLHTGLISGVNHGRRGVLHGCHLYRAVHIILMLCPVQLQ